MTTVGVIGAGASGLIAGAFAARGGCTVEIIDRNEKPGKKLFLTGKGRCNITNSAGLDEFLKAIPHNGRFMYGAFGRFFNDDIIKILNDNGVDTKLERGGRYFPQSDKSSDVIRALARFAERAGATIRLIAKVVAVEKRRDGEGFSVTYEDGVKRLYDRIIIATGGVSYPSTGSTGDGYAFAEHLGHTVLPPRAALIPLETVEDWARELMGLSLKNIVLRAYKPQKRKEGGSNGAARAQARSKPVYEELGEMLFTHFGVSGPLVLSASSYIADAPEGARLEIDLKPALSHETLDARIVRDFEKYRHKQVRNAMCELMPQRLIETVLMLSGVNPEITVDCLKREDRRSIVSTMKALPLTVSGTRPIDEAVITRGGIPIKEINPSTMESKLVPGLYFAGEIIDVDACTGGYNLQIAWSTGAVAGMSASDS